MSVSQPAKVGLDIPDGGASIPRGIDPPGAVDVTLLN
jgi:hypothetical protein